MTIYEGHRDQRWGATSYAQHGDDFMIINLFEMLEIEKPLYLDIGAHDPTTLSNTKLLYQRGSSGVNVDANPKLIEAFNVERPRDRNINVGVGTQFGEQTFFMYSDTSGRNTFSAEEVKSLDGIMTVRRMVQLPVVTLDWIVEKYCNGVWPHLLSMDIEGYDYDVLNTSKFRGDYPGSMLCPIVVVVETRRYESKRMITMMKSKGYAAYCRMGENLFFVRQPLESKLY